VVDKTGDKTGEWDAILRDQAAGYAQVALANIGREFPTVIWHIMSDAADLPPRPRELTPVFYGSLDWHSCVEMHWLLVRLLRLATASGASGLAGIVPVAQIRAALDGQFTAEGLAAEARWVASKAGTGERPYGWTWALELIHETSTWDDADARRWSAAMAPLAEALTARTLGWLAEATYPVRYGMHTNSAFALSRALPFARQRAAGGAPALSTAISAAAMTWFRADTDYPARYEPAGYDFLSPALTEADLMAVMLPGGEFGLWLDRFMPFIADREPAALFSPVTVSDDSDGQIAHLHGLNVSRAWCWRRIAASLPDGDPRIEPALAAARTHAAASLPYAVGSDYMVEHWLAAYAVLLLT
jgi:hypothetical protein